MPASENITGVALVDKFIFVTSTYLFIFAAILVQKLLHVDFLGAPDPEEAELSKNGI